VASFDGEAFDVGAERFGDPQPVQGQQRDQGVFAATGQHGGDQEGADLVAVQTNGPGLLVEFRSADMRRW
jgi:hypothetical protein